MANVTENLMSRLDVKWVEKFKKLKSREHRVAWIRNYPTQSSEEESIMQILVDKLDPPTPSITRVSQVREEMQRDEAKGTNGEHRIDTPEGEAYWQDKLDTASKLDEADRVAAVEQRQAEIKKLFPELFKDDEFSEIAPSTPLSKLPSISVNMATNKATLQEESKPATEQAPVKKQEKISAINIDSCELDSVPGFGKDTINKFIDKGIVSKEKLFELTYTQALAIAKTGLVLAKIKDKFKPEK